MISHLFLSVLPFSLLYLTPSASSPLLSLCLEYLSVELILRGFLKGHRGEETFFFFFCSTCLSDVVQSKKSVKTTRTGRRRRQWKRLKGNVSVKLTISNLSRVEEDQSLASVVADKQTIVAKIKKGRT